MIDTVNFRCLLPLKEGVVLPFGMKNRDKHVTDLRARVTRRNDTLVITEWEVSLPKVLFGKNDKLITSQAKLDEAMEKSWVILSRFADTSNRSGGFARVDICWQFAFDPQLLILAHKDVNHPLLRGDVNLWRDKQRITGLEYVGGKTAKLLLYDKTDRKLPRFKKITRVEMQLHGRRLRKEFHVKKLEKLESLEIHKAYQILRHILLSFPKPNKVPRLTNFDKLCLYAQQKGFPLFEHRLRGLGAVQIARLRKQRIDTIKHEVEFEWAEMLPLVFPPPVEEPCSRPKPRLKF